MRLSKLFGFLPVALLALAGCHEIGHVDGLGDYGTSSSTDVVGEVQYVDTRTREIEIRTDAGRASVLRYDRNTQVIYRQKSYAVDNLEPGDYVAARVERDREGRNFTDTITVKETAQDRGYSSSGGGGRLDRAEGRVEYVDQRRGTFEIRDRRNRLVIVQVAFNAPRPVAERFNRLRNGDYVRIEGRSVSTDRFELENFL
jgi:exosome complex RNA-binding protein Csl4